MRYLTEANEVVSKQGGSLEDALVLLNGGLTKEETEKLLRKKCKKQEREKRRKLRIKRKRNSVFNRLNSKYLARRQKRRAVRVDRVIARWGNLANSIRTKAYVTFIWWRIMVPMIIALSCLPCLADDYVGPVVVRVIGIATVVTGLFLGVLNAIRIINGRNYLIYRMWMPRRMFERWVDRIGRRCFINNGGYVSRPRLVRLLGEKEATKAIEERQALIKEQNLEKRRRSEKKNEEISLAYRYSSSWPEAVCLYEEAHEPFDGGWALAALMVIWIGLSALVSYLLEEIGLGLLMSATTLACLPVAYAMTYGLCWLVLHRRCDFEYNLHRILRKRAIHRVMDE